MRFSASSFVRAGLLALVLAFVAYGQGDLATITGVVTDPAEAAAPGVTVTIRNVETNIARTIESNHEGYFTIASLNPGHYELTAAKQGFHTFRETGIVLEVGQNLRADVRLTVGSVTETVSVTADVAPLNTENGTVKGDVIVQAEIQDIPLNGRDFTELALLVPGVMPSPGGGSFASINGARSDNTNYRVDGFDDRNIRGAAAQFRPNVDAMQEFKMEVSGYSAEYGKMAGGVLNMVLRSGTNQFHGSLFEYLRNQISDARAYFDSEKLGFHQNQFGGTIMGPLSIPKAYNGHDRTFFMFSWESYRNTWGQTKLGNVPSALERVGDFTQTVNNAGKPITVQNPFASPNTTPFPGNVIPASLISPIAVKLMAYYPLPNRTALGNNHLATATNLSNWDSLVGKLDHRFNSQDSIAGRFGKRFGRSNAPWAGSNLGIFQNYVRDDRELGGVDYLHMFSPTLLTEARIGLSRSSTREHIISGGADTALELGMQGSSHDPMLRGFPLVNVTNYLSLGYANNEPVQYFVTDWQFGDKFTWFKGKHLLKWGFDYSRYQFNQPYFNNSRGTMAANGVWTGGGTATNGNAIGDLLLGLLNSSSMTTQINRNYMREQGYGFWANDDFKITRSLTLNLGLRYEIETPPYDKYDRMFNFIPDFGKIVISSSRTLPNYDQLVTDAMLTNVVGLAKDYGLPRSLVYTFYKGLSPRVGFAWRVRDGLVLRSGYGLFYGGQSLNDVRNGLDNSFPFVQAANYSRSTTDPNALTLLSPWNPK